MSSKPDFQLGNGKEENENRNGKEERREREIRRIQTVEI
jgi:hypothetical protein